MSSNELRFWFPLNLEKVSLDVSANKRRSYFYLPASVREKQDYSPVSWNKYYSSYRDITIGENTFRVYLKGKRGPLLVLLHGGGYSALSWSVLIDRVTSFAECQIAAIDLRGHGETHCANEYDLSVETLSNDVASVVRSLFENEELPPVILVGHSLGGALAVRAAYRNLIPNIIALVVIDVVEGSAFKVLPCMQDFLRRRPASFSSLHAAVKWGLQSGQVITLESAKVSIPGQLKNAATNQCAVRDIDCETFDQISGLHHVVPTVSILEKTKVVQQEKSGSSSDDQKHSQGVSSLQSNAVKQPDSVSSPCKYIWRIDLSKTEKFWTGWFRGLSNMFSSTTVPKLLLLTDVDGLDAKLLKKHMEGKFEMHALPRCGHALHEDDPKQVAQLIAAFMVRHKFTYALCEFQKTFSSY